MIFEEKENKKSFCFIFFFFHLHVNNDKVIRLARLPSEKKNEKKQPAIAAVIVFA